MLYTFTQLAVQRRFDLEASCETAKSTLRSSLFIFFHAYNGSVMGCALRRTFGRFYYRVLVCAPALLSSYLALIIEKPARRQALAFYLLNLASEIVFRMAVTKGYFKPIKHGETLLFSLSLAAWYYLLKAHGFGRDPVSAAVKVLVGREEAKSRRSADKLRNTSSTDTQTAAEKKPQKVTNYLVKLLNKFAEQVDSLASSCKFGECHPTCPHQEISCLLYVLKPIPTRYLLGHSIQFVLRLSAQPLKLFAEPAKTIRESLYATSSIRFGLFLASLVSTGRLTSCLLRRYSNSNSLNWHGAVSGLVAGASMLWSPKSSLSMYIMWKAVEQYYLLAVRQKRVEYFEFTILTIYAASAATILYTFALEPRFVRPSYMRFLDKLSDHRLHQLNRMVLDVFGTGSSIGYEDYFPDLDPKHMSNQFKELVFNWMIQPYE